MRKLIPVLAVAVAFCGLSLLAGAADDKEKVKLEGMAQCAKCALKETKECQNVVVVTKDGKETKVYMVMNDVAKEAHQSAGFCSAKKGSGPTVKVEGTWEDKEKNLLLPEKIEKVEEE